MQSQRYTCSRPVHLALLRRFVQVPRDLRKTMASSILITGGTAMLPGFIPRLHAEIIRALSTPPPSPSKPSKHSRPPPPVYDRYSMLRPLLPYFAILNNPNPPAGTSERAKMNAGKAPAFAPALMAWVGGSLAGSLKTGGAEVARERWDEIDDQNRAADESMDVSPDAGPEAGQESPQKVKSILPDWTRSPLPAGAPSARAPPVIPVQ